MKSRKMSWPGHVARMWERRRNSYMIRVGTPLGISRYIWEDNIKLNLRYNLMVWTGLIVLKIGTKRGLF
jgi:hypothetical protein